MTNPLKILPKSLKQRLLSLIISGHERTVKAKKNIIISFFVKGLNILISFIQVPIALDYLGTTSYGVWLILGSIISWFGFFDIGLGNGLRNNFAKALAENDKKSAKIFVSTTYAILLLIITIIFLIFSIFNRNLDWFRIFNVTSDINENLVLLVYIVFTSFCIRFILKLITTILVADQRPAFQDIILVLGRILNLVILIILLKTTKGSLIYMGLVFSASPVLVLILASIYFYSKDYKEYVPSFKFVDFKYARELMNLGVKFFIIQLAVLVLYTTDNMIITQLFGPDQVTIYNIAFKYFSIITMGFLIIINPFWSTVTEAYHKNEFSWIKKIIKQLVIVWTGFFLIAGIMLTFSGWVYKIWVGPEIKIPFYLSVAMAVFVVLHTFNFIFIYFINGTGKIKVQIYVALVNMIFNIPLSILFARYLNFGITGVIMGTIVSAIIGLILAPLQYYKIITRTARGIWNK